jgi:hypothetical protein
MKASLPTHRNVALRTCSTNSEQCDRYYVLCCFAAVQVLRVFHDRLISPEDKQVLQEKVSELVQRR